MSDCLTKVSLRNTDIQLQQSERPNYDLFTPKISNMSHWNQIKFLHLKGHVAFKTLMSLM